MDAEPDKCLESWSDELISRSDRVRMLIGPVHWLSVGHHKEELVRQFLIRHFPARFRITRGFISTSEIGRVSREIDIMVTDSEAELPWFAEGDLVIAPPASVRAQIHVKTEFDVKELTDVMSSGAHNQKACNTGPHRPWFGAVFFAKSKLTKPGDAERIWKAALSKVNKGKFHDPDTFPDCIAIINGPFFLANRDEPAKGTISVKAYDCGGGSPAAFLNDLSENLPLSGRTSLRRGEWFYILSKLAKRVIFSDQYLVRHENLPT